MEKNQELEFVQVIARADVPKRTKIHKVSVAEKILLEFLTSGGKYAKIPFSKIKDNYSSTISATRGIGRRISSMKLQDKVSTFADKENVYLEKLEKTEEKKKK